MPGRSGRDIGTMGAGPAGREDPIVGLRVRTVPFPAPADLLSLLPEPSTLAWVRNRTGVHEGLLGWGEAARFDVTGAERFSRAHRWWHRMAAAADARSPLATPGTGLVAFLSFAFDPRQPSVIVVPRVVIGRSGGVPFLTAITRDCEPAPDLDALAATVLGPHAAARPLPALTWTGANDEAGWRARIVAGITRVAAGEVDKVVLARTVRGRAAAAIDERLLLHRLARRYPECWTFAVAGLVGATPELLVSRHGNRVRSRVLAGTVGRSGDAGTDGRLTAGLLGSAKDLAEHRYAVHSVATALGMHCTDIAMPPRPRVLRLATVAHLATDISADLADGATALDLAASLHPTAAVCGTPTERAQALIDELEGSERGRYAGPVGWIDATGDGEIGLALRCAQLGGPGDPTALTLFAGCGIVAGSTEEGEWRESEAKLAAMREALSD